MNLKYQIFDLAAALAIVAASILTHCCTLGLLVGNHMKVEAASENNVHTPPHYCEEPNASANTPAYVVGEIVEVFEPNLHPSYAFFAQITRVSPDGSKGNEYAVQYDVRLGFGGAVYENIAASAISPMAPFEERAHAMCDEGKSLNSKLVPCTVDFSVPSSKRFFGNVDAQQVEVEHPWLYSISYQESGEWRQKNVPVSRIRRIMKQDSGKRNHRYEKERSSGNEKSSRSGSGSAQEIHQEPKHEEESGIFPIGSVVEIYGPGGALAFPATVTSISNDQEAAQGKKYNLTHGITQHKLKNIDAQFVHPYHIYKDGTPASCNVGKSWKIILVPCTVMSHVQDDDDGIIYRLSSKSMDPSSSDDRIIFLPRFRVQRRMGVMIEADQ